MIDPNIPNELEDQMDEGMHKNLKNKKEKDANNKRKFFCIICKKITPHLNYGGLYECMEHEQ